jgi:hypothetical protein
MSTINEPTVIKLCTSIYIQHNMLQINIHVAKFF